MKILVALFLLLTVILQQGCKSDRLADRREPSLISATDALGRKVSLQEYPRRIVSTAPSNTEILLALGLSGKLVGVTSFYRWPEKVEGIAKIGGYTNPSVEKIVSLRPDIVFAARGNPKNVIEQLRRHRVKVFTLDTQTISCLFSDMQKVAVLTGTVRQAERRVAEMEEQIGRIRQTVKHLSERQKPRVLWVGQEEPLRTAGPGSLIDELIGVAGGTNVASDEKIPWPLYNTEKLLLRDPQVIILGEDKYKDSPGRVSDSIARFEKDSIWRNISAVKAGRVHYIPTDLLGQPSPAFVAGLEMLARHLHPDLFPELVGNKHQAHMESASD